MTKYLKEYKWQLLLSLALTIAHIAVVIRRDLVTFHMPSPAPVYAYLVIGFMPVFIFAFYYLLLYVLKKLYQKDTALLSYAKPFLLYFGCMTVLWIMTWPGIFKGDEFYVIKAVTNFDLSPAQSGLTSFFYMIALMFFPSMATIVLFQLIIVCCIVAILMHDLTEWIPGKLSYLLWIPLFFFPVLDGNLFTLRATIVGYLFLYLVIKFYCLCKTEQANTKSVWIMAVLCGLLIAWRSEYIYLLLFLPLGFFLLKKISLKKAVLFLLIGFISFQVCNIPNKIALNGSNKYPISLVLNPLANMFTEVETLKGPDVYDDIMTINELVDVQLLKQSASPRNISQYWNIPDILEKDTLNRFMSASFRLIAYNPGKFLKYRIQTFAYTNGFYPDRVNHPGGECISAITDLNYYDMDYKTWFVCMKAPLGRNLRKNVISLLAFRDYNPDQVKTFGPYPLVYNCVPAIALLLILFIISIFKKNGTNLITTLLIVPSLVLIFLTAPAMFFMYYFGFYLCAYFFSVIMILQLFCNKKII